MNTLNIEEGDYVWSPRKGLMQVEAIAETSSYPIQARPCHIRDAEVSCYTEDGKYEKEDVVPEICHFDPTIHRPYFRVDDPIIVLECDTSNIPIRRRFAGWAEDGGILVWENGRDSWTTTLGSTPAMYKIWRLPTEGELEDVS